MGAEVLLLREPMIIGFLFLLSRRTSNMRLVVKLGHWPCLVGRFVGLAFSFVLAQRDSTCYSLFGGRGYKRHRHMEVLFHLVSVVAVDDAASLRGLVNVLSAIEEGTDVAV